MIASRPHVTPSPALSAPASLARRHVVRDALMGGSAGNITVTLSDGVTKLPGVVEHADAISDIAIVRVQSAAPLPCVTLGSSAELRPGECARPSRVRPPADEPAREPPRTRRADLSSRWARRSG